MPSKKSRPIEEKIKECLDVKIQNLHPDLREKLFVELQNISEASNVSKCKSYVSKLLLLPEMGKHAKQYWISRGWSEVEAYIKSQENTKRDIISPYSIQFWTSKINPNTGKHYTEDEANYERNSIRPIRKEYWIKKGYSLNDAEKLATDTKNTNNKNGAKKSKNLNENIKRATSKRCLEYWTIRGFSEIEGKENISQEQSTFSLKTCIEKYGEDCGKQKWLDRQEKWQKTLNMKSDDEKYEINKKKATKINYRSLWNKDLNQDGMLYLIKVYNSEEEFYKIGVTSRSLYTRFGGNKIKNYSYDILDVFTDTIHRVFLLEQKIIKENKNISYVPKQKFEGWTECFYDKPIINS